MSQVTAFVDLNLCYPTFQIYFYYNGDEDTLVCQVGLIWENDQIWLF